MTRTSVRRGRGTGARAAIVWAACCLGLLGLAGAAATRAGASSASAQPGEGLTGWAVVYKAPKGAARPPADATAHSPSAAFALEPGQSPHPSVAAAGFTAVYSARMKIVAPGRYRFGGEVEGGTLSISVFGPAITSPAGHKIDGSARSRGAAINPGMSEWLTLKPGELNLRVEFARAGDAPARLRTMWEQQGAGAKGFAPEPIPFSAVMVPVSAEGTAAGADAGVHGRMLLGELGCIRCHAPVAASAVLDRPGPLLAGIGGRASPEWLSAWVRDPQRLKPGCGMPDVLGETPQDAADAEAIVQYLLSLGGPFDAEPVATEPTVIESGRRLYLETGCIACHGDSPLASDSPVPFGLLAGKWRASALSEFLQDPHATRPAGRMPSLDLSESEADLITAFLLNTWGGSGSPAPAPAPALVEAGKKAFAARGCADCHHSADPADRVVSTLQARPLPALRADKGCLDPSSRTSPRYDLAAEDRAALASALQQVKTWSGAPAPADHAALSVSALGCMNCHEWHGAGGVRESIAPHFKTTVDADLGPDGLPPRLTGVGGKLATGWLREVLSESGRARPYMLARMPQFGAAADGLAEHLASFDGVWPDGDRPEPEVTPDASQAGLKLVGAQGLNCISCHAFGDAPLAGTPGPDILGFAGRLRYDWWRRYILSPERFKPGTKMTNFFIDGHSINTAILAGDAAKQTDALWAYFSLGEFAPTPEGIASPQGLEVKVGSRPLVLRTFLKSAGSRGIAVGFPAGTHFAFDADNCRLTEVWRGKFLDATGAWSGRGGTIVGGQGPDLWLPPPGPPIHIGDRPETWPAETGRSAGYRFKGYALDADGAPAFTYTIDAPTGRVTITERFAPLPGSSVTIRRRFDIAGAAGADLWINAGAGRIAAAAEPPGSAEVQTVTAAGVTWVRVKRQAINDQSTAVVLEISP